MAKFFPASCPHLDHHHLLNDSAFARSSIPRRKPLPRDNVSVPNFTTLASTLPTPVLTPVSAHKEKVRYCTMLFGLCVADVTLLQVEAARLVFLDSDEPEEDEELSPRGEYIRPASPGGPVGPGTPVTPGGIPASASRDFSLLHQQFTPKRRSESYTSHLGHAAELQQRQLQEEQDLQQDLLRQQQVEMQQQKAQRTIPKSASVRFQPHLEEVSVRQGPCRPAGAALCESRLTAAVRLALQVSDENISSTSDYASIETVNRLSSASTYSNRPSPVDSGGTTFSPANVSCPPNPQCTLRTESTF